MEKKKKMIVIYKFRGHIKQKGHKLNIHSIRTTPTELEVRGHRVCRILRLTFLHSGHPCFEIHWGDGSTNYCGDVLLAQRNAIWQPCIIEVKFQHKPARFTKHNNWWELYMTSMEMGMNTPGSKREEINIIRLPEGVCMCVIRWWEIGVNREFLSEIFKQFTGTW